MPRKFFVAAAAMLAALFAGSACSRFEAAPQPLTRRVAVLDFRVPSDHGQETARYRSYWLGAHTHFQNRRDGVVFADALASRLATLPYVLLHSRADVRYYMQSKRRLLMDRFKNLERSEYDRLLDEVSPLDYGIELGVDLVVTGRIIEAYMSEHHTIHTWYSYVKAEVDVWDISAGQVVWNRVFERKKYFNSKPELMERVSDDIVRALDRNFFRADAR